MRLLILLIFLCLVGCNKTVDVPKEFCKSVPTGKILKEVETDSTCILKDDSNLICLHSLDSKQEVITHQYETTCIFLEYK